MQTVGQELVERINITSSELKSELQNNLQALIY